VWQLWLAVRSAAKAMTAIMRMSQELRDTVQHWRKADARIAVVPTMGALHAGHLDLVRAARSRADKVIATIFVNPAQFAAHEDLGRYPRQEAADHALLAEAGCDVLYAPSVEAIYPQGFATQVHVSGITARLEGTFRPHFFAGVTTIVAKLLLQAAPDLAFFGEKDWQQLQVVTKMVQDLDMGVTIVGVPTRREADGLAMSSRNAYLTPQERAIAPALKQAIDHAFERIQTTPKMAEAAISDAQKSVLAAGFASVDYLEACHAHTLEPLRILAAAWLGKTRLIDNWGG
jgi:pantoate--beta-alanine ligase